MIYLVKWKNHGHRKKKAPVQCFMIPVDYLPEESGITFLPS